MNDKTLLKKVRKMLSAGNVAEAEKGLALVQEHNAEYYYLHSEADYLKGWTNECRKNLEKAIELDPENKEYKDTYEKIINGVPSSEALHGTENYPYTVKQMGSWKDGCAEGCCECSCMLCCEGLLEGICNGC